MCKHEMRTYTGLCEVYDYCTKCNKKDSELLAAVTVQPNTFQPGKTILNNSPEWAKYTIAPDGTPIPKRTGYTEFRVNGEDATESEYMQMAGLSSWIPAAPTLNNQIGCLKELYSDDKFNDLVYQTPWMKYCNEAMTQVYNDMAIFGTGMIKFQEDLPPVRVNPIDQFFGVNRSIEPYRLSAEYKPSEPEEKYINITKTEFFQAFEKIRNKKRCRGIHPKMAEEIWTEMECDWNGEPDDSAES